MDKIRKYTTLNLQPYFNLTKRNGVLHLITYEEMIKFQKRVAFSLVEETIGFPPSRIGTHSMHVTLATSLFNQGYSDAVIMAEGRWESNALNKLIKE